MSEGIQVTIHSSGMIPMVHSKGPILRPIMISQHTYDALLNQGYDVRKVVPGSNPERELAKIQDDAEKLAQQVADEAASAARQVQLDQEAVAAAAIKEEVDRAAAANALATGVPVDTTEADDAAIDDALKNAVTPDELKEPASNPAVTDEEPGTGGEPTGQTANKTADENADENAKAIEQEAEEEAEADEDLVDVEEGAEDYVYDEPSLVNHTKKDLGEILALRGVEFDAKLNKVELVKKVIESNPEAAE
jgi:hypothetical protein